MTQKLIRNAIPETELAFGFQWMEPRPPGGASTTCPSSSVITCPDEIERMTKVKLCEGILLDGLWFSRRSAVKFSEIVVGM